MPANPPGQLEVMLCRREVGSRETAIPIWRIEERRRLPGLGRTLIRLASGMVLSGIAGRHTVLGMDAEPRRNLGVAGWSARSPNWQCWLPELPIPLHSLAPGPGR